MGFRHVGTRHPVGTDKTMSALPKRIGGKSTQKAGKVRYSY